MIGERYAIDREIGRGGMGAVWLAHDDVLGRAVAVKRIGVMPGGTSPDALRAEREARIAASLNHPHIVGVFDLVYDTDQQYLVMEFVEGRTLGALIRESGPLPARQAARILAQAASALAFAHENGIVHRDVKPSNILVRDDGHAKLSDFGIARTEADVSLTQTGMVTGSPAYLAPEVATGRPATPASDVWSLGATLFHALAGRPPYDVGDNVLGALYQIVNEPPPRLPAAGEMEPVLLATMAHDPGRRWAMADVASALALLAEGQPIAVAPVASTAVVPPVPPAPPAPVAPVTPDQPTRTVREMPTPAPTPHAGPAAGDRRRRPLLPALVTLVVLALVVVIVALVLMDDPQGTPGQGGSTPAASSGASDDPTSGSPSQPEPPSEAELEAFVDDYLAAADADPAQGFTMLTPDFQRISGGLEGYEGFWDNVSNVRLLSVTTDPDALTVSYTYRYNYRGDGVKTEDVGLQLQRSGDGFLIAGEA